MGKLHLLFKLVGEADLEIAFTKCRLLPQQHQGTVYVIDPLTQEDVLIIPTDRLRIETAIVVDRTIHTGIDGIIVSEFAKLPDHLRSGDGIEESGHQFYAA